MKQFLFKKRINILICTIVICVTSVLSVTVFNFMDSENKNTSLSLEELYNNAVKDAMTIETEEILPILSVKKDSNMMKWNKQGDKVLMVTWHKYPDSYKNGEKANLKYGEVWTFSLPEIESWYDNNSKGVTDWNMRFCQLIGLPPTAAYTHFTLMWTDPNDMLRPSYNSDILSFEVLTAFKETESNEFKQWFEGNIIYSYFNNTYPWTRLGYTYDWADNGREYGLSEFIIKKDSSVEVEQTLTTQEFVNLLKAS